MIAVIIVGTFITSLISGVFGMAGGVILIGFYAVLLPVPTAMVLHGIAQACSNGFRAWFFRDYIIWGIFPYYTLGSVVSLAICFWIAYIPSREFIFLSLGIVAIVSVFMPGVKKLDMENKFTSATSGFLITFMQIFSGVSGPLLDIFYLNNKMNRYQIIACKALTQAAGHFLKLVYYGSFMYASLQDDFVLPYWVIYIVILMTLLGAWSGKFLVKYFTDELFLKATMWIILLVGIVYIYKGLEEGGYFEMFAI